MVGVAPGLFPSRDPGRSPVERVGFSRARLSPGPPRSPLGWAGSSRALVCGPPSQAGGGINPGWINQGPSAVPRELTAQETPLGPFELATNAPFPSLPCSGVSRLFTFHRSLGLDCPPLSPPRHSGTPDALSSAST